MDGNGRTSKGFKIEWMTVKDGILYVGSMGKGDCDVLLSPLYVGGDLLFIYIYQYCCCCRPMVNRRRVDVT